MNKIQLTTLKHNTCCASVACFSFLKYTCCSMLGCMVMIQASAQTDFDSLKRNSNLDTSYRPSQKPTFVTEFAEVTISGFIQPAFYFDNNNVLNNDVFVTSEIPTKELQILNFNALIFLQTKAGLDLILNFQKPVPILLPSWKAIFYQVPGV